MPSIVVNATVQSGGTVSAGTVATSLKPGKRTFSLTGVLGTTFVKGDVVGLWGSNDGGTTYQPLRKGNNEPVQLNYYNPEVVIDDACDHYATQRLGVGSGSALAAVGFNGETTTYTNGAWLVGGNNIGGIVGVLGTLDASPFQIKAEGVDIFDSDGSTTALGNTEAAVPGNSLQLAAGAGGGQFAVTGAGTLDLQTASGALSVNTTGGAINIGTGTNAKTITVGNVTGTTTVALLAGTGGIGMAATGAGGVQISAGATASVTLEGGTSGVNVGTNAVAQPIVVGNATGATSVTVNVGTGGLTLGTNLTVHDVNIGSSAGASSVAIVGGTGGVGVGSNPVAQTVTIGNATGATAVNVNCGTGGATFGANATVHTTTIGSITGASATALKAGTGGLTIVNNGATWTWPTAIGGAGTKLTDAAGNGVLSFA